MKPLASDPFAWRTVTRPARWLDATTPDAARGAVERAIVDIGICEDPPSSNRSPYIDQCLRMANVPESLIVAGKGWWCASVAGRWWREVGAAVPDDYGATRAWVEWHPEHATLAWMDAHPTPGAMIMYGTKSLTGAVAYGGVRWDIHHIGLCIRAAPYLETVEGNAAWGGAFTANGEAVVARHVDTTLPTIAGYIPISYGLSRV